MLQLRNVIIALGLLLSATQNVLATTGNSQLQVGSKEYKLLLKPERFTDRQQAISHYWQAVQQAAQASGVQAVPAKQMMKEESALYAYLDDDHQRLHAQHYILRVVRPFAGDQPGDKVNVMLKYRVADRSKIDAIAVAVGADQQALSKLEEDVIGFIDSVVGRNQSQLSLSAQIKKLPDDPLRQQLDQYATLFPTLATLGLEPQTRLTAVGGEILNIGLNPGKLHFSDGSKSSLEIAIWYRHQDNRLMVGEISFDIDLTTGDSTRVTQSEAFFNALQQQLQADMLPGASKTAQAYLATQP